MRSMHHWWYFSMIDDFWDWDAYSEKGLLLVVDVLMTLTSDDLTDLRLPMRGLIWPFHKDHGVWYEKKNP